MKHVETFAKDNMLAKGQELRGIDESKAVELPLEAGQFSLHHERTAHSSLRTARTIAASALRSSTCRRA